MRIMYLLISSPPFLPRRARRHRLLSLTSPSMARAAPDPILSCSSLAANSGGTLQTEYVKRNCSVHKRVQIRKQFKNTEVWVKLYYIEAQVKLQKKKKLLIDLLLSPKAHFHNSSTTIPVKFGNFIAGRCRSSSGPWSASLSLLLTLKTEFLSLHFLFSQMRICSPSSDWQL